MPWPPFFAQSLALGSPEFGVGLCLLWTPQDRVLPALSPADYALAGNLYSRDGVSFLVRTVLARPTIRAILLCGRDMTGSGEALVSLVRDGLDERGRIVGEGTRLHPEIPREAVELFRRSVTLHDARDTVRPEAIAALLAGLRRPAEPFAPAPLAFPYSEPTSAALPAADTGLLLRDRFVRGAYLKLIGTCSASACAAAPSTAPTSARSSMCSPWWATSRPTRRPSPTPTGCPSAARASAGACPTAD